MQTNIKTASTQEYLRYIRLGETGHYPLFYQDWLNESLIQKQNINFTKASRNVKSIFTQLSKHKTLEKKKTALIGMDKLQREEFIRSFFKVVEHQMLQDTRTLQ